MKEHYKYKNKNKLTITKKILLTLSLRHNILSVMFVVVAILVFVNTISLQIRSDNIPEINSSLGVSRERIITAPRGNIYDRRGIPIAISEEINVLYLANANLDNASLNEMLLNLANYLEEKNIKYKNSLSDYLQINPLKFEKEEWEIISWQNNRNIFNLQKNENPGVVEYSDKKLIKTNPVSFFNYLRYTLFNLDSKYTIDESYKIIVLRYELFIDSWNFRNGKPIEIARNVDNETIAFLEEQNYKYTGILSGQVFERRYLPDAEYLGHVVGYLGAISPKQYDDLQSAGYQINDVVGQYGVEYSAERYLKGTDGIRPYNILTANPQNNIYYSEEIGIEPIAGNDVHLTIDLNLQKVAMNSLKENIDYIRNNPRDKNKGDADSGAVVVMDVNTGELLVMASYPTFNPNDFIMAQYDEESENRMIEALTNTKDKPMLNRTIMEIYAPGSTFKPITAIAALENNINTNIRCGGTEIIGEWEFRCLTRPYIGHGMLDLNNAMETSCNIYFHKMGVATGINQIDYWMKAFGLGEYTGVDLPGETKGFRSNRETKALLRQDPSDQMWFPADTAQTAIGQFDNKFTVLQLARYAAGVATGNLVQPFVIKEVVDSRGVINNLGGSNPTKIDVKESTLNSVVDSMEAVANAGTVGRIFSDFPIQIAAKTGTAETGREDNSSSNALFIVFAPAQNPEIAIAQIVEKGVWGSNTISISYDLLVEYFGLEENIEFESVIIPIID